MMLDGEVKDKDTLQRAKIELCRRYALPKVPANSETLALVDSRDLAKVKEILRRKPVRTLSGVAVVAVMTSPAPCPHGKCIFCPGGVENGSPQSYTGKEPAARRGASYGFDPYEQVKGRIEQLEAIGHGTDKIDLIIRPLSEVDQEMFSSQSEGWEQARRGHDLAIIDWKTVVEG